MLKKQRESLHNAQLHYAYYIDIIILAIRVYRMMKADNAGMMCVGNAEF